MPKNEWGFSESRPGGGTGVMTSKVLGDQPGQPQTKPAQQAKAKAPAEHKPEQQFTKENLLFLKEWLEASLKDVDETLAKL